MVNLPTGVPVLGDFPLLNQTWYSVELYAEHFVEEYNGTMIFALEEDIYWEEGDSWKWAHAGGNQKKFHLIAPASESALRVQF
jgi:hypothetical protein